MKNNVISGFTLSNENYIYPNSKWNENENILKKLFGVIIMSVKTKEYFKVYEKKLVNLIDSEIISNLCIYGKRDLIDSKLYHLGWDAWKDDADYWKHKISENNWNSRKDSNDTDEEPTFKVYTNDN